VLGHASRARLADALVLGFLAPLFGIACARLHGMSRLALALAVSAGSR